MSKSTFNQKCAIPGQMMDFPLTLTHILKRMCQAVSMRHVSTKTHNGTIHRYSYRECYQRVCRLAHALEKLGVKPGDRVGTLAWNTFEHMELYFAIPCFGAVVHTLNLRLSSDQLAYIIDHAEDRILFVDVSLVPLLEKIKSHLKTVQKFVVIGAGKDFKTSLSEVLHYDDLLSAESDDYVWPELDEKSAAGLCYTSGTTGNPKGVLYSHRSQFLHAMGVSMTDTLGLGAADTVMAVVPMFHANAWGLPYAATLVGADLVFPGPHLKSADLAQLIEDCRVTVAAGVPTLWISLFQELKTRRYDFRSLRTLVVGGAAMPRALIQAFEDDLNIPIVHAWGMTELSPLGTTTGTVESTRGLTAAEKYDWKARQGRVAPVLELRIVGDSGNILPWDGKTPGDLEVRGPWVAASYYRDSDANAQFGEDGWFKTGDVATLDSLGCMTIVDRSKDLIKSGGEWISSVALENALMAHPGVLEAAVIGVPDEKWTERPMALIVPKKECPPTLEDLKNELEKSFVKFWIPESFRVISEIPKTSVGKFDKKKLRQQFSEGLLS